MLQRHAPFPGVIGVFTQADLTDVGPIPGGIGFPRPDGGPAPKTDRTLLASDRVRFVGEPVALVVSETRSAALEASDAVVVDYQERPVVTDPIAAMQPGAPAVWDDVPDNIGFLWKRGDAARTDQALRDAAHVTKLQFFVSRVTANSMEPRGAWAEVGADGRLCCTPPSNLRSRCATGWHNRISSWNQRIFACFPATSAVRSA